MTAPAAHEGLLLGIDVGTTSMKALAMDSTGRILGSASEPTVWDVTSGGQTQMPADRLADTAIAVLAAAARDAQGAGGGPVLGIGITGLAETGVVLDANGQPRMPAIAWYDQRGKEELAALPADFQELFQATTGLACKAECSFAKLLWLHGTGFRIEAGQTWLNALEYIAFRLTGQMISEPSLASRTGLLDQQSVTPWGETLHRIGAEPTLIPRLVNAGTNIGAVSEQGPEELRGAAVTVGGHDHLVASVGAGAVGGDDLFNSCGTADVIVRSLPRTLSNDERAQLVGRGLSAGRYVLADSTAILGATRSGLVLGRVLALLGMRDRTARQRLADAWDPKPLSATGVNNVEVSEPSGWTNEVTIRLREYVTPDELWNAAMQYVLGETEVLLGAVTQIAGPYEQAIASGGWAQLRGVLRGKASVMPGLQLSSHEQAGCRGAAIFAANAAGLADSPLGSALHTSGIHVTAH